jgi:large subunit ribosomal protein L29
MKHTKPAELKDKSIEELEQMLLAERAGLFQTRRDLVFRKIQDTASVKVRRHNIARILTLLNNKKRESK